jgi:plastocyanin
LLPAREISAIALVAAVTLAGLLVTLSPPPAKAQSTVNVSIQGYSFNPGNITVVIGVNNTVTWTNHDVVTHTVTGSDGSWGSGVPPGASYTHTFATAGIFAYHCSIHQYMHGEVVVLNSSSQASTSTAPPSTTTSTVTTSVSATTTYGAPTSQTVSTVTSASSSSATQSSSTGPGQASGVPEFPAAGLAILVLTAFLVGVYFATKKTLGSLGGPRA